MSKPRISVNAGHSTKVKGAVGYLDEAVEVEKIAAYLVQKFKLAGYTCGLAPNNGGSVGAYLREEYGHANNMGADYAISIHMNAGGGTGTECWIYPGSKSYTKAAQISRGLANHLGLPNRGVKHSNKLAFLRKTKAKAILVEVLFVDSKSDYNAYKRTSPEAIADAIFKAFDEVKSVVKQQPGQPKPAPKLKTMSFPLLGGHWYGVESRDNRNHSGYWSKDRPAIKKIQAKLGVSVDGIYGRKTRAAVTAYQKNNGLRIDGAVGAQTWSHMFNGGKAQKSTFPLPHGHWYGIESKNPKNHSGYWTRDRAAVRKIQAKVGTKQDGIYGRKTRAAVIGFQRTHGLKADGYVGIKTWSKMF